MIFEIQNMKASRVNLLMNDFCAGLPSPLSFLGFGDAIARRLDLAPWSAGVIPILHRVTPSSGRTKPEMEWKKGAFSPIETIEDMTGHVDLSLLIDLPGLESAATLRDVIPWMRVGGGTLQNDDFDVREVTPDGTSFRGFRRGYAMVRPEPALAKITTTGATKELRRFARTIFPAERQPGSGWLIPAAVGYRLIENPATAPTRTQTRSKTVPHVFAEPMVGISELISVRNQKLTGLLGRNLSALFWRWHAHGEHVVGHASYHPTENVNMKDEHHG